MKMQCIGIEFPDKKELQEILPNRCSCNWKTTIARKIPITTWLPLYNTKWLLHDLLAGFTVALTEIPQSIAYAGIAGLPLQYGLYSSFMGGFIYAIFGSCRAINMGSTSIMALLIQPYVNKMGVDASIFMSLVGGVIIFLLGLLNFGFIIEFFSYPVMAGFTSAAALTIASSQMKNFLGMAGQANGFLESWRDVVKEVDKMSKWDAVLGAISLLLLFILREIGSVGNKSKNPMLKQAVFVLSVAKNVIVVALGMTVAYFLEKQDLHYLKLTGCVDGGFPYFKLPAIDNFTDLFQEFGISLILIPLVAILETVAIAKVFSKSESLDGSQEMVALGIANIMGSFVQSMPVTGSFTRTAVNNASGTKSNMAAVFTGVAILVTLPFLTSTFYYIPRATLAAVIICAMFYLFEFEAVTLFWRNKKMDLIPFVTTFLSSLFLSLEYGILIGIATHLTFVLYSVARPNIELTKLKILGFEEVHLVTPKTILFPAAEFLRNVVLECGQERPLVVFDGRSIDSMDVTVAKSIAATVKEMESRNQKIVLLNFQKSVENVCVGVDQNLKKHLRAGDLEDILTQDRPSTRLNEVYSLQ